MAPGIGRAVEELRTHNRGHSNNRINADELLLDVHRPRDLTSNVSVPEVPRFYTHIQENFSTGQIDPSPRQCSEQNRAHPNHHDRQCGNAI